MARAAAKSNIIFEEEEAVVRRYVRKNALGLKIILRPMQTRIPPKIKVPVEITKVVNSIDNKSTITCMGDHYSASLFLRNFFQGNRQTFCYMA